MITYILAGGLLICIFAIIYFLVQDSKHKEEIANYKYIYSDLQRREAEVNVKEQQLKENYSNSRAQIEKERNAIIQRTQARMRQEVEEHREEMMRLAVEEAEREYGAQIARMAEEKDKYVLYLNQELEEDSQSFLESTNTLRFMERKIASEVEDVASRLVSLIEAEKSLLDESRQKTLMLPLSREDIADLRLLMEDILPRIRREDVIRKLIWVEYIQKPTFALVSDVFPMNTPGIYKITNINTKKSYVGRSVDVRARVVEHIKSSLGLGSISDQAIHHAMREEGLENFMFELLEDCEKDKLAEREKYYIGIFQSDSFGWNKTKGG